jgi:hypothetical protein
MVTQIGAKLSDLFNPRYRFTPHFLRLARIASTRCKHMKANELNESAALPGALKRLANSTPKSAHNCNHLTA